MRSAFSAEFDVPAGYLNTPSIGVPPAAVADAVASAVGRWRTGADVPPAFDESIEISRHGFADLVGVPAERVAIGAGVSQLIGNVAAALPGGARVLAAEGEFTSVTFPFAAVPGVTVTEAPLADLPSRVEGFDLVAVSVVQSADGSMVDLEALHKASEAANVPVLLDATQAAGWFPLALDWADWVVGASYKWIMAPRGAAWLAVHPRALERARPVAAGWYAGKSPWESLYGMPLRLAEGARRLDLSPVWLAHVGAAVSLPYLNSLDLEAVRAHCTGLADSLLIALGHQPRGSAIVSLEADPDALRDAGVVASARAGRARVGFHLYNTEEDVARVAEAVTKSAR